MTARHPLLDQAEEALTVLDRHLARWQTRPRDAADQADLHAFAWTATYVRAMRELHAWGVHLARGGRFGDLEQRLLHAGFGEYLAQLRGGIPISQLEFARSPDASMLDHPALRALIESGTATPVRLEIAQILATRFPGDVFGDVALLDDALDAIRTECRRFVEARVAPFAHRWHLADELIPDDVIASMAGLGYFGLCVPEAYGGLGLGKMAMAVTSEELSRGYIGVGSLGTRSEIAAELIRLNGTEAQKRRWLPSLADGSVLPTAVFTEPNHGSDLGAMRTRAVRDGDRYRVHGNKTWITHASRSDLMTLLVRTDPSSTDFNGLSMLLAAKPRGRNDDAFPVDGLKGTEIGVLGYRGMKEYELAFDGFSVDAGQLLGGVEGRGFKQLMATFESARVQTAARATGVAQNALELGMAYALDRRQFGRRLVDFPRVASKLAWMAVETMIARQLTYFAAREKDGDRRCDVEAGMAKLLAARVAWSNADGAVQIHGGNGFSLEYPVSRVLCDARVLSIFEGAAEIQADVIGKRLLQG
jgi:(2S)-methylsuccinyl-CoA dehydrogenase